MVSQHSIQDVGTTQSAHAPILLVTVTIGTQTTWGPGTVNAQANLNISPENAKAKIEAAIFDVFFDIMIANGTVISHMRSKFLRSQNTLEDFFRKKAEYARTVRSKDQNAGAFSNYSPDRYASFATLARQNTMPGPLAHNLDALMAHWDGFLGAHLSNYYLSPTEAAELVTQTSFRRSSIGRRDSSGQNISKKAKFGSISHRKLLQPLSNKQIAHTSGPYVLMILTRKPPVGEVNKIGPIMGWANQTNKTVKSMKLISADEYPTYKQHVADGTLTPIRLYIDPEKG